MTKQDIAHELKQLLQDPNWNRISLVIALREKFQLTLAGAMDAIREFETTEGSLVPAGGLSAYIYAIGNFQKDLVDYLEYPANDYKNLPEGTPIIHLQFEIYRDTNKCNSIAQAFGIDDPLDFNQHKIKVEQIDYEKLGQSLADHGYENDEIRDELNHLRCFVQAGFEFMFRLTEIET
ncbi:MAG: hypothetical protein K8F91_05875 [Candidatus Obscuribacterales bacterium]|nr:hypothetical protein [Candidatus Obscuribacterales bacterium]